MKVQKCKGMRDLFPVELGKFRTISDVFRDSCLKWGYDEVKTPTLEYLHLFTSAGTLTPGMLGKVYSFLDWDGWSGERVVLRPDATIPVARLYIENMAGKELAKLFYIENVFMFEETGKKEREKWQCGAELIGVGSPAADVELIVLALEILKKLGLKKVELKLSHAGLTRGILQKLGLSHEEQDQVFDQILDGDSAALSRIKAARPELSSLLELQGKSSGFVKNLAASFSRDLPDMKSQVNDFVAIIDLLHSLGCDYQIDISSVRGFEYYTGVIFQLFVEDERVGGGGRYDALIPAMGGTDAMASGFALYMDLLMNLINPESPSEAAGIVLVKAEPETMTEAFAVSKNLREAGYVVKTFLGGKGPGDIRWKLTIRQSKPKFLLTDKSRRTKFELETESEILQTLERK
jgi:histidyl-tRNA synthetase